MLRRCFALLSAVALISGATESAASEKKIPAPDWQLTDVDGKPVKLSDFRGKVVVLNFWATWCPPCRAEIPGFIEIQKKYADQGFSMIGVSLDREGPSVVKPFIAKFGMNYPVVMGNERVASDYGGITAIPTTFVIDRQGNIVAGYQGLTDQGTFESVITKLLKEPPGS